jgi:hypothetical protein
MSQNPSTPSPWQERHPYEAPAVIFEAPLEVRASAPLHLFFALRLTRALSLHKGVYYAQS